MHLSSARDDVIIPMTEEKDSNNANSQNFVFYSTLKTWKYELLSTFVNTKCYKMWTFMYRLVTLKGTNCELLYTFCTSKRYKMWTFITFSNSKMYLYIPFIAKKVSFDVMIETFVTLCHLSFNIWSFKMCKSWNSALYERNRKDTFHNLSYFTKVCHLDLLM